MTKKLVDAGKSLREGRFGEAVRNLDGILESPYDSLFQPDMSSPHRSLKAEAERLLGELPPEGLDLYELEYGARAGKLLDERWRPMIASDWPNCPGGFFTPAAGCRPPTCSGSTI